MRRVLMLAMLIGCGSEAAPTRATESAAADQVWRVARDAVDLEEMREARLKVQARGAREAMEAARSAAEREAARARLETTALEVGHTQRRIRHVKRETFRAARKRPVLGDFGCPHNPLGRGCS